MQRRNKIIIGLFSGLFLISGLAACNHHHSPQEKADYVVKKITSKLSLNDTQTVKLNELKDELLAARKSVHSDRSDMISEVESLLSQNTLDQQRVLQLLQGKIDTVNARAPQIITALAGFYDSLDPEQQNIIREKIRQHKDHTEHWHH